MVFFEECYGIHLHRGAYLAAFCGYLRVLPLNSLGYANILMHNTVLKIQLPITVFQKNQIALILANFPPSAYTPLLLDNHLSLTNKVIVVPGNRKIVSHCFKYTILFKATLLVILSIKL